MASTMSTSLTSTLSLLFLLLTPLVAAQCKTFTPNKNASTSAISYTASGPEIPISWGLTCNGTTACNFGSYGSLQPNVTQEGPLPGSLVTDNRTLNWTSSSHSTAAQSSLFDLITKTSNVTLASSLSDNTTGGVGFQREPGQSGYVVFIPYHTCVSGALSGCSGTDYPSDGTVVEACAPYTPPGPQCNTGKGLSCMAGEVTFVNTDLQTANEVVCDACLLYEQKYVGSHGSGAIRNVAGPQGLALLVGLAWAGLFGLSLA